MVPLTRQAGLIDKLKSLGAESHLSLITETTYLVAETDTGDKYASALANHIPIMRPSFIEDMHAAWLVGQSVDLATYEDEHRYTCLHAVAYTMTAVLDPLRDLAKRVLVRAGATYHASYSRSSCTHLFVGDKVSDLAEIAAMPKVAAARKGGVPVLWLQWGIDCALAGGLLPTEGYTIDRPCPPPRRKTATPASSSEMLREASAIMAEETHAAGPSATYRTTKRLAADADDDPAERAVVRKKPRLGGRRGETADDLLAVFRPAPSQQQPLAGPSSTIPPPASTARASSEDPTTSLRRLDVRRGITGSSAAAGTSARALSRALTAKSGLSAVFSEATLSDREPGSSMDVDDSGIADEASWLRDVSIALHELGQPASEERCASLIRLRGGRVVDMADAEYIVTAPFNPPDDVDLTNRRFVSPAWLERCEYLGELKDPHEHILSLPHRLPIPMPGASSPFMTLADRSGADKLQVSLSGLDECDERLLQRLCKRVDIRCANAYLPGVTTHVITRGYADGAKAVVAAQDNVPCRSVEWLVDLIKAAGPPGEASAAEPQPIAGPSDKSRILAGCVIMLSRKFEVRGSKS